MKKQMLIALLFAGLFGCGVETASTAATAASLKKQEVEQGKQDMARFQQQLEQTNQAAQQRAATMEQAGK